MIFDRLAKNLWKKKIQLRRDRLEVKKQDLRQDPQTPGEAVKVAGDIAERFLKKKRDFGTNISLYHHHSPCAGAYATYTYAAYLNLMEGLDEREWKNNVDLAVGFASPMSSNKSGTLHYWLECIHENDQRVIGECSPFFKADETNYKPHILLKLKDDECIMRPPNLFTHIGLSVLYLWNR